MKRKIEMESSYFIQTKNLIYSGILKRLIFPIELYLEITNVCNLSCIYCYKSLDNNNPISNRYMPIDLIEKIFREAAICSQKYNLPVMIILEGGEPFLHPQLEKIIGLSKQLLIPIDLLTNGLFFEKKSVNILINLFCNKLNEIQISLDGIGNDNISNRGVSSYSILKNINMLNKYSIKPRINTVVTKKNIGGIELLVAEMEEKFNISSITLNLPKGSYNLNLLPSSKEVEELRKKLELTKKSVAFHIFDNLGTKRPKNCDFRDVSANNHFRRCTAMSSKISISCNGDLYPCVFFEGKQAPLGNVVKNNIENIWNSEDSNRFVENIIKKNSNCFFCVHNTECTQYCAGEY